ncbi:hypothetical protein SORBI_3006G123800, partial [Sorghum bicolor]
KLNKKLSNWPISWVYQLKYFEYQLQIFVIVRGFSSVYLKEETHEDKRKLLRICFVQVRYMTYYFFIFI